MRNNARTAFFLGGLALTAASPAYAVAPAAAARVAPHVPGQVLVKFRDDASLLEIDRQLVRLGAVPARGLRGERRERLDVSANDDVMAVVARLRASGLVEYAEPNYLRRPLVACSALAAPHVCPNDLTTAQYALHDQNATDADMDLPEAWALTAHAEDVLIAIADDGFNLAHADLDANLRVGVSCDGSGSCSGTAASQSTSESHGSMVAGAAAAVGGNGNQIASPVLTGDVLPIRLADFTSEALVDAIDHAIASGARVLNLSLGGPAFSQAEFDALQRARDAGMLVIAAAGNTDSNTDEARSSYPANYDLANILAIASSNAGDAVSSFSIWGSMTVDLAAAGEDVVTTARNGNITFTAGTSFSAPYTTGVAALVGQHLIDGGDNSWDYRALKARLLAGADVASDAGDLLLRGRVAAGRVNARHAMDAPAGGVLLVRGIAFDDSTSILATNNANGMPDPGETFDIVLTLGNSWQAAGSIDGTLSILSPQGGLALVDATDTFTEPGAVGAAESTTTGRFRATLSGSGAHAYWTLRLDLLPQAGAAQTRYVRFDAGTLPNGVEQEADFQTTDWDEFHAWHATVPVGATNVVFETHTDNGIDIDLLARRDAKPEYLITLNVNPESGDATFWAGQESSTPAIVSGRFDGEELIGDSAGEPGTDIVGLQSGTWHLVTANFDQSFHRYRIKASWDAGGAGTVRFTGPTSEVRESAGVAMLQVVRSGGTGTVSVSYATQPASADLSDYTTTTGTLTWGPGDTAPKVISVPLVEDNLDESAEVFHVTLSNPTGGADIGRYSDMSVTLRDPSSGGGGDGGGGGGGSPDPLTLVLLGIAAAARRLRGARS